MHTAQSTVNTVPLLHPLCQMPGDTFYSSGGEGPQEGAGAGAGAPYTLLDQQSASKGPFRSNFTLNGQQKRAKNKEPTPPPPTQDPIEITTYSTSAK